MDKVVKEMQEIVLTYPKLKQRVANSEEAKQKALKSLKEIAADVSEPVLKGFGKFLDAVIYKLYHGIFIQSPPDTDFIKLVKENNVILVPNHQSHADYIAVNYMVYKTFKLPLYVAGGINLNVFPIGPLFRKSGCFFIRRSFKKDIIYKLVFEAYLYYLLIKGKPIEFFFEGGRSRSGKLLPPKYGFFNMLVEAHDCVPKEHKRPLLFVPTSISHEYVPEQKSMSRELEGGAKKKESFLQILKLYKIFSYQLGSVHIRLGKPIEPLEQEDERQKIQKLAFGCFHSVGKNIVVSPSSLIALIMLDEPVGAMKWDDILTKAKKILSFCDKFKVPVTETLQGDKVEGALEHALDILIGNRKVNVLGKSRFGNVFYSIREDCRKEVLYSKNTILHHFLVPWIINLGWIKMFQGQFTTPLELRAFFDTQLNQLKHEFYLPPRSEFLHQALTLLSDVVGRPIQTIEECMAVNYKDMYAIISTLGIFSRGFSYIYEGYYISSLALLSLIKDDLNRQFSYEEYQKEFLSIFHTEFTHGQIVKYVESGTLPLIKSSFAYFSNEKVVAKKEDKFFVTNAPRLSRRISSYAGDLKAQLMFNIKF
ncbi:MAG: 1-acyl-sn-glycerol-3-phosphate acyltransferase [Bacteriovoracaceae bacterium]|nr:1-acyl-sn-glycerol-3-phosphate acyltransferase [Bacteriovoracaceae bacterium]